MIDVDQFTSKRPYLYHLTDRKNLEGIKAVGKLLSTRVIVENSDLEDKVKFLKTKRVAHATIVTNIGVISIRDQRPISEKVLSRCLTNKWTPADFLYHLNERIFFWPTVERLNRHFDRYKAEKPVILRFSTEQILKLNKNAELSRLNSGATRCNSYLGGNAPERGPDTFQKINEYNNSLTSIAEVTIPTECGLPNIFHYSNQPLGRWMQIQI